MNPLQKQPNQRTQEEIEAEIERLAREQGVERFNFKEAINDLSEEWTDEDERAFEEFMTQRQKEREAEREAQKKEWLS